MAIPRASQLGSWVNTKRFADGKTATRFDLFEEPLTKIEPLRTTKGFEIAGFCF